MMEKLCTHPERRRRAAGVARMRRLRQAAPRARRSRPPAGRCTRSAFRRPAARASTIADGPRVGRADAAAPRDAADGADARRRAHGRHDLRRLRRHVGTHRQPRDGRRVRPPGRQTAPRRSSRRPASSSAWSTCMAERASNARALGEELKRTVAKAARVLRHARLRELRAGQRRRRLDDDRGEVARRLREVRPVARSTAS